MTKTIHAIERARERYGLELKIKDLRNIEKMIRKDMGVLVDKNVGEGKQQYLVLYNGRIMAVVYSSKTQMIVTFPPIARKKWNHKK